MKYVPQFDNLYYTKTRHSIFGSDSMTAERLHEDCIKIEQRNATDEHSEFLTSYRS